MSFDLEGSKVRYTFLRMLIAFINYYCPSVNELVFN